MITFILTPILKDNVTELGTKWVISTDRNGEEIIDIIDYDQNKLHILEYDLSNLSDDIYCTAYRKLNIDGNERVIKVIPKKIINRDSMNKYQNGVSDPIYKSRIRVNDDPNNLYIKLDFNTRYKFSNFTKCYIEIRNNKDGIIYRNVYNTLDIVIDKSNLYNVGNNLFTIYAILYNDLGNISNTSKRDYVLRYGDFIYPYNIANINPNIDNVIYVGGDLNSSSTYRSAIYDKNGKKIFEVYNTTDNYTLPAFTLKYGMTYTYRVYKDNNLRLEFKFKLNENILIDVSNIDYDYKYKLIEYGKNINNKNMVDIKFNSTIIYSKYVEPNTDDNIDDYMDTINNNISDIYNIIDEFKSSGENDKLTDIKNKLININNILDNINGGFNSIPIYDNFINLYKALLELDSIYRDSNNENDFKNIIIQLKTAHITIYNKSFNITIGSFRKEFKYYNMIPIESNITSLFKHISIDGERHAISYKYNNKLYIEILKINRLSYSIDSRTTIKLDIDISKLNSVNIIVNKNRDKIYFNNIVNGKHKLSYININNTYGNIIDLVNIDLPEYNGKEVNKGFTLFLDKYGYINLIGSTYTSNDQPYGYNTLYRYNENQDSFDNILTIPDEYTNTSVVILNLINGEHLLLPINKPTNKGLIINIDNYSVREIIFDTDNTNIPNTFVNGIVKGPFIGINEKTYKLV